MHCEFPTRGKGSKRPPAAGPQGPGGHNNFSESALAGLLISVPHSLTSPPSLGGRGGGVLGY